VIRREGRAGGREHLGRVVLAVVRVWAGPIAAGLIAAALLAGCGSAGLAAPTTAIPSALLARARPIGAGPRFHPPNRGPVTGPCRGRLGARDGVHVELFAANRVVIIPAGIGSRPPRSVSEGRLLRARCYGDLVTLDPTGVVLVRPGSGDVLSELFHAWGQPLSSTRLASFRAAGGRRVAVFVNGRPWSGAPQSVPLARHSEIVLEVGPHVPPHASYTFPPGL
jgi:hypothetical protein